MRSIIGGFVLLATLALGTGAAAQVVNGDFESAAFPPWVVSDTPNGTSIFSGVGLFDIDGPGERPASQTASFIVGRRGTNTGYEGVQVLQDVGLLGNTTYVLRCNWAVHSYVNVYNQTGGRFELMVDGTPIAQVEAPTTAINQRTYGDLSATFRAEQTRAYSIGVRITRPIPAGEEVVQYLDDISLLELCRADFNEDGSVTSQDYFDFLVAFFAGDADFNGDRVTNSQDFFDFLTAFFIPCG